MKYRTILFSFIVTSFFVTTFFVVARQTASAHVVVKPNQAGIGAFQIFSVGVPVEKNIPTVGLRLVIPSGLDYVSPNVKPGWKISVKKDSDATDAKVTEINWIGGVIPAGQRDDFVFSAKVPSTATTLQWKAYQTYADDSVVSWDHAATDQPKDKNGNSDFSAIGPYSETQIVDDLKPATANSVTGSNNNGAFTLSIIALVFSIIALGKSRRPSSN